GGGAAAQAVQRAKAHGSVPLPAGGAAEPGDSPCSGAGHRAMTLRLRSRMPMAVAYGAVALALLARGCTTTTTTPPTPPPPRAARAWAAGQGGAGGMAPAGPHPPEFPLPVPEQGLYQPRQRTQFRPVDVPAAVLVRQWRPAAAEPLAQPGQPAGMVREHGHHH